KNYKKIAHRDNNGTVYNLYEGLKSSSGRIIKPISPGDALISDSSLYNWAKALVDSNMKWSFSDAVYYSYIEKKENKPNTFSGLAHPRGVKPYLKNSYKICRRNYVVYNDIVLGATTICYRDMLLKYTEIILGKVIYAEDNMYRIMVYDGYVPYYYPSNTIYYEYGTGVSTSNNKLWSNKISSDWEATDCIMDGRKCDDKFIYMYKNKSNKVANYLLRLHVLAIKGIKRILRCCYCRRTEI
ncbi:MAG: hypothetical protein K5656_12265, partial [Lachnospiraceae bacterium]|nr:hypothetical protein [Lachnospiraceae bacterium]